MSEHKNHIQAVLFDKTHWTVKDAKKKLAEMGLKLLKGKKVHVTGDDDEGNIRFRIVQPDYDNYNYRTLNLSPDEHIKAIYGYAKRAPRMWNEFVKHYKTMKGGSLKDSLKDAKPLYDEFKRGGGIIDSINEWLSKHFAAPAINAVVNRLKGNK